MNIPMPNIPITNNNVFFFNPIFKKAFHLCFKKIYISPFYPPYMHFNYFSIFSYFLLFFCIFLQFYTKPLQMKIPKYKNMQSSRRRWLTAVLSHHRAYRSVHGGFNSWRAQTDRLWLNHKSHCLSVFLLSLPCLLQLYALRTNVHVGYYPLALPSLRALPSWWGYVPLSSVSSTVSIYTYVFCDRAIRWCHLCCSSYLQFRSS